MHEAGAIDSSGGLAPLAYPNTIPGSPHAVYLMDAKTRTIVATPEDIWKFKSLTMQEIRDAAIAEGGDPDRAVTTAAPPSVWVRSLRVGEDRSPLRVRSNGEWGNNPSKGRTSGAVFSVEGRVITIGQWFEAYEDGATGVPLQAKLWLAPALHRIAAARRYHSRGRGRGRGRERGSGPTSDRDPADDISYVIPCDETGRALTLDEFRAAVDVVSSS